MSHEIERNYFLSNDGRPAWHSIGKVRKMVQTFGEALIEILGGIRYSLNPAGFFDPENGSWNELPDQRAVVYRDPKADIVRSFGLVGKDFQIVQPERLIELLDPVLEDYPVATAGLLRGGSSIFLALGGPDFEVMGEKHGSYLTFDLSFEPGRTLKAYSTIFRTVCANTQEAGLQETNLRFDVSHVGDVDAKVTLAAELVRSFHESRDAFAGIMERWAAYEVNDAEIDAVLDAAFAMPSRPKNLSQTIDKMSPEQIAVMADGSGAVAELINDLTKTERAYVNSVARSEHAHEAARDALATFNVDFPEFAGSAYAVFNAVTQTADWRADRNGKTRGNVAERVAPGGPRFREKIRGGQMISKIVRN